MKTLESILCTAHTRRVLSDVSLSALSQVISQKDNPAILGGNPSVRGYSIFAAEPVEVFEFQLDDRQPVEKLRKVLSKYQWNKNTKHSYSEQREEFFPRILHSVQENTKKAPDPFFFGGWIGFFGYELGRFIEKLPSRAVDDLGLPIIRLAFYDKAIVYDHTHKTFSLAVLELEHDEVGFERKFSALENWLGEAASCNVRDLPQTKFTDIQIKTLSCNMTRSQYMEAIARIKHYIYEGDTYQINFSQRFAAPFHARAVDLFGWQNRYNPSPYAAYLAWDNTAIVSASPELFLQVTGDRIVTKPIKGTRPRNPLLADTATENKAAFEDLLHSEKDQAELAMIVDLERNDLARICVPGTRRVRCPRQLETFPTVYHAAGIIEGTLRQSPGPQRIIEILKSTFPGGSITGAPKIRSMEIIDELEPTARGIYTGCIGWIGLNFDLCLNIAIRTIIISNNTAYIQTGGGIVTDSTPQAEWAETLTKARALLSGIHAVSH